MPTSKNQYVIAPGGKLYNRLGDSWDKYLFYDLLNDNISATKKYTSLKRTAFFANSAGFIDDADPASFIKKMLPEVYTVWAETIVEYRDSPFRKKVLSAGYQSKIGKLFEWKPDFKFEANYGQLEELHAVHKALKSETSEVKERFFREILDNLKDIEWIEGYYNKFDESKLKVLENMSDTQLENWKTNLSSLDAIDEDLKAITTFQGQLDTDIKALQVQQEFYQNQENSLLEKSITKKITELEELKELKNISTSEIKVLQELADSNLLSNNPKILWEIWEVVEKAAVNLDEVKNTDELIELLETKKINFWKNADEFATIFKNIDSIKFTKLMKIGADENIFKLALKFISKAK